MKRILIWAVIFAVLALDWAALDDITTGNEPGYFGEYATLLLGLLFFVLLVLFKKIKIGRP